MKRARNKKKTHQKKTVTPDKRWQALHQKYLAGKDVNLSEEELAKLYAKPMMIIPVGRDAEEQAASYREYFSKTGSGELSKPDEDSCVFEFEEYFTKELIRQFKKSRSEWGKTYEREHEELMKGPLTPERFKEFYQKMEPAFKKLAEKCDDKRCAYSQCMKTIPEGGKRRDYCCDEHRNAARVERSRKNQKATEKTPVKVKRINREHPTPPIRIEGLPHDIKEGLRRRASEDPQVERDLYEILSGIKRIY